MCNVQFPYFCYTRICLVFDQFPFACVGKRFVLVGNFTFIDASSTKIRGSFVGNRICFVRDV